MMGDFGIIYSRQQVAVVGTQTVSTSVLGSLGTLVTVNRTVPTSFVRETLVPGGALGALKVAENASPMPEDRVFVFDNAYGHIVGPLTPGNSPIYTATPPSAAAVKTF